MSTGAGLNVTKRHSGLKVCTYGDPVLRREAETVAEITPAVRELAEAMVASMYRDDGIGLAAPQVGRSLRVIALDTGAPEAEAGLAGAVSAGERLLFPRMPVALVNPRVISSVPETDTAEEGCLSIPGVCGPVARSVSIVLHARLLSGESVHVQCGGLLARCLQHEIDHLNGVLFVDHLAEAEFRRVAPDLRTLENETARSLQGQS